MHCKPNRNKRFLFRPTRRGTLVSTSIGSISLDNCFSNNLYREFDHSENSFSTIEFVSATQTEKKLNDILLPCLWRVLPCLRPTFNSSGHSAIPNWPPSHFSLNSFHCGTVRSLSMPIGSLVAMLFMKWNFKSPARPCRSETRKKIEGGRRECVWRIWAK